MLFDFIGKNGVRVEVGVWGAIYSGRVAAKGLLIEQNSECSVVIPYQPVSVPFKIQQKAGSV